MSMTAETDDPRLDALRTIPLTKAAKFLGIGRDRAYKLNQEGKFPVPVREIDGKYRVLINDIEQLLEESKIQDKGA